MPVQREHFQLPAANEVTSKLSVATVFRKLDAKDGYWYVKLDAESSKLTKFNIPFRQYKFNKLPFALNSNEVFQKKMQQAFEGIDGVDVIFDDILINANNDEEHDMRLGQALDRAREKGTKLKKQNC
uniref:Uncharacterized protein K02A2.6-like n=1 Tax=Saccoglossus kowalevskii TaxID=10224 RepID=A0ABM0MSB6_SACKO|nr:PREDICTED: uncharacterized protein K02A2.6-like [Saccoglossus kowalevskii]